MRVVSSSDNRGISSTGYRKELNDEFTLFYDNHYSPFIPDQEEKPCCTNLSTVLDYERTSMITSLNNHIIAHFENFLNRYINIITNKKDNEDKKKANKVKKNINKEIMSNIF